MSKPTIGLIGLGAMGRGMAGSLRKAGYDLYVCDAVKELADQFVQDGGNCLPHPI